MKGECTRGKETGNISGGNSRKTIHKNEGGVQRM